MEGQEGQHRSGGALDVALALFKSVIQVFDLQNFDDRPCPYEFKFTSTACRPARLAQLLLMPTLSGTRFAAIARSRKRRVADLDRFLAWVFAAISGENFTTQRFSVAWSTNTHRSARIFQCRGRRPHSGKKKHCVKDHRHWVVNALQIDHVFVPPAAPARSNYLHDCRPSRKPEKFATVPAKAPIFRSCRSKTQ